MKAKYKRGMHGKVPVKLLCYVCVYHAPFKRREYYDKLARFIANLTDNSMCGLFERPYFVNGENIAPNVSEVMDAIKNN